MQSLGPVRQTRDGARGIDWSVPVAVVATPAPAYAMSPAACTITPTGDLSYDAKYTCSRPNNPRGFDPERYLMAFRLMSNCPSSVLGSGSVQIMVEERGNRPLTNVHVVKSELADFAGLSYNGRAFPAGLYLAVTFFHPTGWGSPNLTGSTGYSLSTDGGATWSGPFDLFDFELRNLDRRTSSTRTGPTPRCPCRPRPLLGGRSAALTSPVSAQVAAL
jgi:hypothetical protein